MSRVVMHNVMSLDGFIADNNSDVGALFDWYFSGDVALRGFSVTQQSADYLESSWAGTGCLVIGRRGWHPDAPYHFVGDIPAAVQQAAELAGDRTVGVAAGQVGGQAFAAGLIDEVAIDLAPVLLGTGRRFFGDLAAPHLLEDPDPVIRGDRVLHLRYRVRRG